MGSLIWTGEQRIEQTLKGRPGSKRKAGKTAVSV